MKKRFITFVLVVLLIAIVGFLIWFINIPKEKYIQQSGFIPSDPKDIKICDGYQFIIEDQREVDGPVEYLCLGKVKQKYPDLVFPNQEELEQLVKNYSFREKPKDYEFSSVKLDGNQVIMIYKNIYDNSKIKTYRSYLYYNDLGWQLTQPG